MKALSLLQSPPPDVALELTPQRVVAVALSGEAGGQDRVRAHAVEPLPPGALVPALNAGNIVRPPDVAGAITRVFNSLGVRPRRVALAVPDSVAKVSFVRFASVPARVSDLDELVRFQVRKAAPFRIEDALVRYEPGLAHADGQEFVVTQARLDVMSEYEQVCAAAGAHAGIVSLSSFAVANAALASIGRPVGDALVIRVQPDTATLGILRNGHLVFLRHRGADGDGHLADLVHQTAMYHQDRLDGHGFTRVWLSGTLPDGDDRASRRALEERLGAPLETIDPTRTVPLADRLSLPPDLIDTLTPALGLALACRS
jgi:Tfp pilus assembly PilM family ATPase